MSDKIRLLSDLVSNQIAAGEVVESPASAVKELLENSVDAGSTAVTLNFRDAGKDLIQIKDNGCGMSPTDARLAFDRHATSKIAALDDIYKLSTFGFRGEALASIAAISQVELQTRQADDEVGSKTCINGGIFQSQSPVACPVGSQFYIRNMFYNVPARRRFLEASTKESVAIIREFKRVAMCHPEVAFKLYKDDALLYDLEATSLAQRIVAAVSNKNVTSKLMDVDVETSIVSVSGYVCHPSAARMRSTDREQFLFVNGRYFESAYFAKAVSQAFEKLVPTGYQPSFFIYLKIDPEQIDVNVHPRKINIKFTDKTAVWQIINAAVRETLAKAGVVPMMNFDENVPEIPISNDTQKAVREPEVTTRREYNPFTDYEPESRRSKADISDFAVPYTFEHKPDETFGDTVFEEVHDEQQGEFILTPVKTHFSDITPLESGYCTALMNGTLVFADLRRAKQQIVFEEYRAALVNHKSIMQTLLFPVDIVMSKDDYTLLRDHETEFITLGFDMRFGEELKIEFTGIPSDADADNLDSLVYDMLDIIRDDIDNPAAQRSERLAAAMARAAAKPIDKISQTEADDLMARLAECSNISYTTDGRPILSKMSVDEIKKRLL